MGAVLVLSDDAGVWCQFISRRLVYIAQLKHLPGNIAEPEEYIRSAEVVIQTWDFERLHMRYGAWIDQVKDRLREV
jgi:hypothetical protein